QHRTDRRIEDCTDHSSAKMDPEWRQQTASDECVQNTNDEITNDSKTKPSHDLTYQPASNETLKQNHQQTYTSHVHSCSSVICTLDHQTDIADHRPRLALSQTRRLEVWPNLL